MSRTNPVPLLLAMLVVVAAAAGCELRPAPKAEPKAEPEPAPAAVPDATPVPAADPTLVEACARSVAHVVDIFIATAPTPENKAQLQQEAPNLTQRMREACVTGKWSASALACLDKATDQAGLEPCDAIIRAGQPPANPPPPMPPPPPARSGSGSGSGGGNEAPR